MNQSANMIAELDRIFMIFNKAFFGGNLEPITYTIQPKKKFSLRWLNESMVIGAEFIDLEHTEILSLILHEMVHISNHQNRLLDVTTNQYHNKNFLKTALDVGFVVIKHKTQGWSITSTMYPRNVVEKAFVKCPNKDIFRLRNNIFDSTIIDKQLLKTGCVDIKNRIKNEKPTKNFFLKYQCNCTPPHNSIRSGRRPDGPNAPNLMCLDCRSIFQCVTDLDG